MENLFENKTLWFLQSNFTLQEIKKLTEFIQTKKMKSSRPLLKSLLENQILNEKRALTLAEKYQSFLTEPFPQNILSRKQLEHLLNKPLSENAPLAFQFQGSLSCLKSPIVGIIGSRHPTFYGREQAHHFAHHLARAGCTVLSGGAIGIDAIANKTAWNQGGDSIAVIGSGLNQLYPFSNLDLFQNLAHSSNGLILSEFSADEPPRKWNFPRRNISIAALCDFIFVVEAAKTSGTLITANMALDLGVDVGALPGSVENPNSQGTNTLIQNGAFCIQRPEDILEKICTKKTRSHF